MIGYAELLMVRDLTPLVYAESLDAILERAGVEPGGVRRLADEAAFAAVTHGATIPQVFVVAFALACKALEMEREGMFP